jgi:membrane protein DedA with SNARE-associated domain
MSKLLVLLLAIGVLGFFLRQFVEALFIATVIVFTAFLFLGIAFTFQGLRTDDTQQVFIGLAMAVFSASYILASYIYVKRRKERD